MKNFVVCFGLCTLIVSTGCNQETAKEKLQQTEDEVAEVAETIKVDAGEIVEKGEQMASELGDKGKQVATDLGEKGKQVATDLGEKGEELASELGEKAMAYITPLKEKLGNLEGLKESPEELKKAVADLIAAIEKKAEDLELPETISSALATVKEKLVALKEYLEGEVDQAKLDERVKEISESVKSAFGFAKE